MCADAVQVGNGIFFFRSLYGDLIVIDDEKLYYISSASEVPDVNHY